VTIFTDDPQKYTETLDNLEYEHYEVLKTVWDNFTPDAPGWRERITVAGKTIFDLVEDLSYEGFYFAERRAVP
jgi:hypothetical protein